MDRPNVLLICVEHWSGRLMSALGHPAVMTPTLDSLAANGVLFTNAYSTTPVCIPARRELMTGAFSRTHGARSFDQTITMDGRPTLPQTFRDAGYQAYAVGKLHVQPQRARIGFDDVMLDEAAKERRHNPDDYEMFLTAEGFHGQQLTHASGNDYFTRAWHLPEHVHPANWTAREMCRYIVRRDPSRPAFWYMSFVPPHPPLTPPAAYMDLYRNVDVGEPFVGDWAEDAESMPYAYRAKQHAVARRSYPEQMLRDARRAYYAQCTHVDHQIRLVIGTLREEGLLDDTVIMLTADHGDMMGNHHHYGKAVFYEDSAKVPMLLVPPAGDPRVGVDREDGHLAALADVMPTLLDICGVPAPDGVEGLSLVGEERRSFLYGELYDDAFATRMAHDGRHKLVYYPTGNRVQLFDLADDPDEMHDVSEDASYAAVREALTQRLIRHMYGGDERWVRDGRLVGEPEPKGAGSPAPDRGLRAQYGWRFT